MLNFKNFINKSLPQSKNKDLDMREMLKITRKLNLVENINNTINKKNVYDQKIEEDKFLTFFDNANIHVNFIDLVVTNNYIFWGGIINGIIRFIFKIKPERQDSGVEINYLDDFSPDNPENKNIVKNIELYYENFFKYWNDNLIQK